MIDNTKLKDMNPDRKIEIVKQLGTIVGLTRAVVETIHDLGPTPTSIVYEALVDHGLVDAGSFDRLLQLACATGSVVREGLIIRPATKAEQHAHDIKMFDQIADIMQAAAKRREEKNGQG